MGPMVFVGHFTFRNKTWSQKTSSCRGVNQHHMVISSRPKDPHDWRTPSFRPTSGPEDCPMLLPLGFDSPQLFLGILNEFDINGIPIRQCTSILVALFMDSTAKFFESLPSTFEVQIHIISYPCQRPDKPSQWFHEPWPRKSE